MKKNKVLATINGYNRLPSKDNRSTPTYLPGLRSVGGRRLWRLDQGSGGTPRRGLGRLDQGSGGRPPYGLGCLDQGSGGRPPCGLGRLDQGSGGRPPRGPVRPAQGSGAPPQPAEGRPPRGSAVSRRGEVCWSSVHGGQPGGLQLRGLRPLHTGRSPMATKLRSLD